MAFTDPITPHRTPSVDRLYFWLDTLCVPLNPASSRKAAIELTADTYKSATSVLVLDSALMHYNIRLPRLEGVIRIFDFELETPVVDTPGSLVRTPSVDCVASESDFIGLG